jgi:hypothetical protein
MATAPTKSPIQPPPARAPLRCSIEAHLIPLLREAAQVDDLSPSEWIQRAVVKRLQGQGFTDDELAPPPAAPPPSDPPRVDDRRAIRD